MINRLVFLILSIVLFNCNIQSQDDSPFIKIFEKSQKKVVKIYGGTLGDENGYASGIIISEDGKIITAIGMFLSSSKLRVTLSNGMVYNAEVIKRDRKKQLALLKINVKTPDYFDLNLSQVAKMGDWVLAIANPFKVADGDEPMSLNLGVISMITELEVKRKNQDVEFEGSSILIDAITGNPGSHGGALVNIDGQLMGMIGKVLEYKGTNTRINYGVPPDTLKKFLLEDENIKNIEKKAYLGIHLFEVSGRKSPAFIDRVDLGSPAFYGGLQKDDLIVSIGDKKTINCEDYRNAISNLKPDVKVQILFKRKDDFFKVDITPKTVEVEVEELENKDEE